MNEDKLRIRAKSVLAATEAYNDRGPKTFAARRSLAIWLETGIFTPEYIAMPTPEATVRWLEYVIMRERGQARLEAIRRRAREAEERL